MDHKIKGSRCGQKRLLPCLGFLMFIDEREYHKHPTTDE